MLKEIKYQNKTILLHSKLNIIYGEANSGKSKFLKEIIKQYSFKTYIIEQYFIPSIPEGID